MSSWLKKYGHIIRAFWVFLVAPLIGSLSWILVAASLLFGLSREWPTFNPFDFLGLLLITGAYAYPVTFGVGIPSYLVYRLCRIESLRSYVIGGFVAGLVLGPFIFGTVDTSPHIPPFVASALIWLTIAIAATVETMFFWAFVIRFDPNIGARSMEVTKPAN
jgi:hypothetical protein